MTSAKYRSIKKQIADKYPPVPCAAGWVVVRKCDQEEFRMRTSDGKVVCIQTPTKKGS